MGHRCYTVYVTKGDIKAGEKEGKPLLAYVQEQEIDSLILKIQQLSFITF